jgi:hypothetical protein
MSHVSWEGTCLALRDDTSDTLQYLLTYIFMRTSRRIQVLFLVSWLTHNFGA